MCNLYLSKGKDLFFPLLVCIGVMRNRQLNKGFLVSVSFSWCILVVYLG